MAKGHPRHLSNKLYGVLLHLNRRLLNLESAHAKQCKIINDDLRDTLNTMNGRMDELLRDMDTLKSGVQTAPAPAPERAILRPEEEPLSVLFQEEPLPVVEEVSEPEEKIPSQEPEIHHTPWLKRLLYRHS